MAQGDKALHRITIAPGDEHIVTFPGRVTLAEVISDGGGDLFGTVNNDTATVDGTNTFRLPAGVLSSLEVEVDGVPSVIRLVATAATVVSIQTGF